MLIVEKMEKIKVKKDFIEAHKDNDILLINSQMNSFGNMKTVIDACMEIDKWLIVEIGLNYFYISKHNSENRNSAQNFLSDRTYKDIITANFNN